MKKDIYVISIFYIHILKISIPHNKTGLGTKCTDTAVNMLPNRNKQSLYEVTFVYILFDSSDNQPGRAIVCRPSFNRTTVCLVPESHHYYYYCYYTSARNG